VAELLTTEAREKISTYLESLEFFYVYLTKFENFSQKFLMTTNVLSGQESFKIVASPKEARDWRPRLGS
jgi:hypothetical protein